MLKVKKAFSQAVLYSVLNYIDEKLPHSMNMDELQNLSGYSKRHLTRLFIQHTGNRPSEYIRIMQAYRVLLELKFTTISINEICEKYQIRDVVNFKINFSKITGLRINEVKECKNIRFDDILKNNKIQIQKKYLSCSFVSLFDYKVQARGIGYTIKRPVDAMMSSHYQLVESVINRFCTEHGFHREDIWTCARFTPFDDEHYEFIITPCVFGNPSRLPEGDSLSIQGDYLCFTWVGKPKDTFPKVKNIYDIFFLRYKAVRKDGYDIVRREKMNGVSGYYVFTYYIPVVINESILAIVEEV